MKFNGKKITIDERTFKGLISWWGIVRYMGINYNILLNIDSGKYYNTLEEAKRAINSAEKQVNIIDIKGKTDRDIYNLLCSIDSKLHINPINFYDVSNFSEYYSPNRKKWILNP
jgi:hypothetical protein